MRHCDINNDVSEQLVLIMNIVLFISNPVSRNDFYLLIY